MRKSMKIKKGDTVKVITGKDAGKTGEVLKVFTDKNRLIVEGVNIVKRHVKPDSANKEGGIIKKEGTIHMSNVMYFDSELKRPVRLGTKTIDGKKYRVNKVTKEVIGK